MPRATSAEPRPAVGGPLPHDLSHSTLFSLQHVAGLLLVAALVAIPLAYGGTRPAGTWALVGLVGCAALCWITGLSLERRLPATSPVLLFGFGSLVVAVLPWLCHWVDPTAVTGFTRAHFAQVAARWPHSVVSSDAGTSVALHASLCLVLWIVADLARDRAWLVIISTTLVATAVCVTLLSLMHNLSPCLGFYWTGKPVAPGFHWGPFFHHTSAGAYLNTAWPLAAGIFFLSRQALPPGRLQHFIGFVSHMALTLLLGAHTSHISRFPQLVALALVPLLLLKLKLFVAVSRRRWFAAMIAGIVLLAVWFGRTGEIVQRWQLLDFSAAKAIRATPPESQWPGLVRADLLIPNRYNGGLFGDRGEAQRTAWRAILARPFTGHGPGNWVGAASQFSSDPYFRTFYLYLQFAHADFLQTWVESGFPGFASILCLLAGGVLVVLLPSLMSHAPEKNILSFAAALGLGAVLLQSMIDFPLQIPAVALNAHVLAGLCWAGATPAFFSASSS